MEKSKASLPTSQQLSNGLAVTPKAVETIDTCVTPTPFSSAKLKEKDGFRNWLLQHQLRMQSLLPLRTSRIHRSLYPGTSSSNMSIQSFP